MSVFQVLQRLLHKFSVNALPKNKSVNNKNTNDKYRCIKRHPIPAPLTCLHQFAGVQNAVNDSYIAPERGTTPASISNPVQLHITISPLSFNMFTHALQVSSSSGDFDCNRNVPSTVFLSSCNLVCLLKYQRKQYHLADMIIELVDHQNTRIANGTNLHTHDNHQGDLISILLASKKFGSVNGNYIISNLQLKDNVMTIFLAGHETVANALTWTFYLLSQNNKEEHKLHEEVDSVLGQDLSPTAADIPKLEYTEKVFTESMRLYPPAWAMGRQAIHDCKIGEYTIPAGSTVLMSQYLMHRDPRFFPEPERFKPERWNIETRTNLPRFSYFPFGGGPRACIGEPFAWTEGILAIATIAGKWKMKLESGHPIALKPLVTLRPKYGMRMKLIRRNV